MFRFRKKESKNQKDSAAKKEAANKSSKSSYLGFKGSAEHLRKGRNKIEISDDEKQSFIELIKERRYITAEERAAFMQVIIANPALLTSRMKIITTGVYTLANITPLEWLLWSNNGECLRLVLEMIANETISLDKHPKFQSELCVQYQQMLDDGASMIEPSELKVKTYNNSALIKALQEYCRQYDKWSSAERQKFWIETIGRLQASTHIHTALKLSLDEIVIDGQHAKPATSSKEALALWSTDTLGKTHALALTPEGIKQFSEAPSKELSERTLEQLIKCEKQFEDNNHFIHDEMRKILCADNLAKIGY